MTDNIQRDLAALHREIYRRNQERIAASVADTGPDFRRYEARYRNHTRRYQAVSTPDELFTELHDADVIYLGDYHTLPQAQKTCVRLLRRLAPTRPDLCVGLEVVQGRHQRALDLHVAGKLGEASFLQRIGFQRHWIFGSFEPFRPILDLVREHGLTALALDLASKPGVTLQERDDYAAERIAIALAAGRPVLALMGELHMAPPHLPTAVKKALAKRDPRRARALKEVIVYQNPEGIYAKLTERGLEHQAEVVRVAPGIFSLNATPPLICQQSFLLWLEEDDRALLDAGVSAEQFRESARLVAQLLGVNVDTELDGVTVHSVGDLRFLNGLRRSGTLTPRELGHLKSQIARGESFYLPRARVAYLASPSINHAAEEATHFVRHACGGDAEPRGAVDAFYYTALNEMMGFFGSKLVNHRRKAPDPKAMRELVQQPPPGRETDARIAQLALSHREGELARELGGVLEVLAAPSPLQYGVAHVLGYWQGERLYYALMHGKVTRDQVRELFQAPLNGEGQSIRAYFRWAHLLRRVRPPARL
ncbi:MAG: ChaN family lipoprotein [Myxococcota bacterium]